MGAMEALARDAVQRVQVDCRWNPPSSPLPRIPLQNCRRENCTLAHYMRLTATALGDPAANAGYDGQPPILPRRFHILFSNRGLFYSAHLGHTAARRAPEVGISPATAGCLYRALMQPRQELLKEIAPYTEALRAVPAAVCLHHRAGDVSLHQSHAHGSASAVDTRAMAEVLHPLACAAAAFRLLNSSTALRTDAGGPLWAGQLAQGSSILFLSSDSLVIKQQRAELARRAGLPAGIRVLATDIVPIHSDAWSGTAANKEGRAGRDDMAAMWTTLAEWFTLAACPAWAGSLNSGFSRTAAAYSLARNILSSEKRFLPPRAACDTSWRTLNHFANIVAKKPNDSHWDTLR